MDTDRRKIATVARRVGRVLALAAAVAGLSTLASGSAHAGIIPRVYQGDDFAQAYHIYSGGVFIAEVAEVCDREADGNGVYVRVWLSSGYEEISDTNGSASGCGSRVHDRNEVEGIEVCERVTGPDWCSGRKNA
ncbi:hypothetical protein AB0O67_03275 [Streptomyces sp. NPDC086077]|uniref:hypothetical protein n=1 Tax=Streptomyces sp. NPDC086077 TaxID=3154862 RepID=UPI00344AD677